MPRINEMKRAQVVALMNTNSQREISQILGINHSSVSRILKKFRETRMIGDRPRTGRPPKFTREERMDLVFLAQKHPQNTSKQLLDKWKTDKKASERTVRRIILEETKKKTKEMTNLNGGK